VSFDVEVGIEAVGEVFGRVIETSTTGLPPKRLDVLS